MSEDQEYPLVHGKRYKADIQLSGFEVMASNEKITDMLSSAGFSDIEVTGQGDTREGIATWSGETQTAPMDRHLYNISEVKVSPDAPLAAKSLRGLRLAVFPFIFTPHACTRRFNFSISEAPFISIKRRA